MAIPTLAMIPSGYKLNKVYSVLPTDGSGDLITARTSTATRINSGGLIEEVAIGVPRLDYTDGGCPSLLLEPASTNLITYSEDFSDASWAKSNLTVTSNSTVSPSGDVDADLIDFTAVSNYLDKSGTITIGEVYTVSCYVKSAVSSNQNFIMYANANKNDGVLSATSEWQRFTYTFTADGTAMSSGLGSDELSQIYAWGFQLEEQSYDTSYIPTVGTAISRTADSASKSGISSLINSSEGVLYAEISALSNDLTNRRITISDGTNDNRVVIGYDGNSNNIFYFVIVGGVNVAAGDGVVSDITEFSKVAIKFKENDFALWVNGVETSSDNSGVTYSANILNSFQFATGANNSSYFYGNCKDLRIYKTALTDSELTTLTTI